MISTSLIRKKRIAVVALAVLGVPFVSACGGTATTSMSATSSPSAAASVAPSSSAAPAISSSAAPANAQAPLPSGLLPAHANVHWDNSASCQSFDLNKVKVHMANKKVIQLVGGRDYHRAVGCVDGFAAVTASNDLAVRGEQDSGVYLGADYDKLKSKSDILIATFNGKRWEIDSAKQEVDSLPTLRQINRKDPRSALSLATAALKKMGVMVDDVTQLIGPDTPTWRHDSGSPWTPLDSKFFVGEKRKDWTVTNVYTVNRITPGGDATVYDQFGVETIGLNYDEIDPIFGDLSKQCGTPADYAILDRVPTSLTDDGKAVQLALLSVRGQGKKSTVSFRLIPQNAPEEGSDCDLPFSMKMGKNWVHAVLKYDIGFESDQEVKAFKDSFEWKDAIHFAQSLREK